MIEAILPAVASGAESLADPPDVVLFPSEEAHVVRAVGKHRREFGTGRHCARLALGVLGVAPVPIPRGESGAPLWPTGVVGSITHCSGYRGAAVAFARDVITIGLDAEPDLPLEQDVLRLVSRPGERQARLLVPAPVIGGRPLAGFSGRWLARDGIILTTVTVLA